MSITYQDNLSISEEVLSKDGSFEPLEIRDVVTLKKTGRNIDHLVGGNIEEGNVRDRWSSDVFVYIVKSSEKRVGSYAFEDEADTFGGLMIASEQNSIDNRRHGPFFDNADTNGVILSYGMMEISIRDGLLSMRPGSVNALPSGYEPAGASGMDYAVAGSGPATRYDYDHSS